MKEINSFIIKIEKDDGEKFLNTEYEKDEGHENAKEFISENQTVLKILDDRIDETAYNT